MAGSVLSEASFQFVDGTFLLCPHSEDGEPVFSTSSDTNSSLSSHSLLLLTPPSTPLPCTISLGVSSPTHRLRRDITATAAWKRILELH